MAGHPLERSRERSNELKIHGHGSPNGLEYDLRILETVGRKNLVEDQIPTICFPCDKFKLGIELDGDWLARGA